MPNVKYKTERQARAAQQKQNARWQKENMTNLMVRFHNKNDSDVLERLAEVPNKAEYIRRLIRADIAKKNGE